MRQNVDNIWLYAIGIEAKRLKNLAVFSLRIAVSLDLRLNLFNTVVH